MLHSILQHHRTRKFNRAFTTPAIGLEDLLKGRPGLSIHLDGWDSDTRAGDFSDSLVMASIAAALRPRLYWEIGTGAGRTALLVARNTADDAELHTLDPGFPVDPEKGVLFRGAPESRKITQHGACSNAFDFSPWTGRADLVFVDGSHAFEDVLVDCEIAFRLVAPGGSILWHDVAIDCPGVAKALHRCSRAGDIRQIRGTRYALHQAPR